MSETPDPLEAELSSLRPHEPSSGLRRRVAERLADSDSHRGLTPPARHGRLWWLAVSGGLAAACLAAVFLWWWAGREPEQKQAREPPQPAPSVLEDPGPTLLAYERALAHSPEELDALLDKHATIAPELNNESVSIGAF